MSANCATATAPTTSRASTTRVVRVSRKNIIKTCGPCHVGIERGYLEGVHGKDYVKGIKDVPVCTDCHSEHDIRLPEDLELDGLRHEGRRRSAPAATTTSALARQYGFLTSRLKTYTDVLPRHGLQVRRDAGGQLRQLPRVPRHPASSRPAIVHQPGQPVRDLRHNATPAPARISPRARSTSSRRRPRGQVGLHSSRSSTSSSSAA